MSISFGPDPVAAEVTALLEALKAGNKQPERRLVDYKEEAGRRGPGGSIQPGEPENERAAKQLAREAACMSNTPGGGALIVGVNDKDEHPLLIGADLDEEWLRFRIYQFTNRMLTVDVRAVSVNNVRLLVVTCPRAIEPIRIDNKIRWRVGDSCQEVDAASWHAQQQRALRFDWSAQASTLRIDDVRPAAAEAARTFLQTSRDEGAQELAAAPLRELLARLNALDGDGHLTNAAALVFVGRDEPCLDYIRREAAGEDSVDRVRQGKRSLLEQLQEAFAVARAHNPVSHIQAGLPIGQLRQLPERALREAIVNGVAHREWGLPDPTLIEHEGGVLRVTSPGGFYGGVTSHNIITHPSTSRNTALTELLAALKIAEREGIGVDRMVGDLLRMGLRMPKFSEIDGPYVVCSLSGLHPDNAWTAWIGAFDTQEAPRNLRLLMAIRLLSDRQWLDEAALAPFIQSSDEETRDVIDHLLELTIAGNPILTLVAGTPAGSPNAYALSPAAIQSLDASYEKLGRLRPVPSRGAAARSFAQHRGRISTTELASIVGATASNVGGLLKDLEAEGVLKPSSPARAGRGFHYIWVGEAG